MSNLDKFEFLVIDIMRKNYLFWILDAKIHSNAIGVGDVIKERNKASEQNKYYKFISCFIVTKQNDDLLIKNHEIRPTNSALFPKVNAVISNS